MGLRKMKLKKKVELRFGLGICKIGIMFVKRKKCIFEIKYVFFYIWFKVDLNYILLFMIIIIINNRFD